MEKKDIKFLKDYSKVLKHTINNSVSIQDANEVLLSNKYYHEYQIAMASGVDYKQAFLDHFKNKFYSLYEEFKKEKEIQPELTKKLKI